LCLNLLQCSWGSKPTPQGTASLPLPPPALAPFSTGVSATDLLAYQRLALSKMASNHPALMGQHSLKQVAALGIGGGASQSIYDGGFQGINTVTGTTSAQQQQQLMYY
jgi:nucleolysin TIA-1/TIAR